ncbi:MAG: tyrosine-type recombinase/integrase [Sphingobium sp.]|uniref:tyrosine-type recombinase/integrase n=1 Tax=Sphingobium sp. TaxID=1912891 RepID=UPI0029BA9427|nr:tyrosine-type recombinase/integrase [Sphingobium sp.]MDX3911347.1 tyrosine-type recombinase/integrase [Sphingobium sp.]
MPKIKLDAAFCLIAQCEPGKRKTDYYDTSTTGFVLEVRPNGGKTFYLRFQDEHGRQRQHKIAAYGDVTFDKARKEAQRLRSQVVLGGDPAATKKEKQAVPLFATVAEQHLAHAKTYQRSYDTTEMYVRRHILPKWGKQRLTDITQREVAQWLAEKAEEGLAPATVEKIRVIFGRSFELAKQWGMAGSDKNPTRGIPRKAINNARERFLDAAEVKRLQVAVASSRNPQLQYIVGLLLLTGARVSELLHAEWKHISLERRVWLIPTSKTGKSRHVPLSQSAIDVIGKVPLFKDCPFLLPNPETLKPFVTIKHAWQTAREEAVLGDLRIHDLRHSAASFMINAGIDLFAVGRVLGHADHKSTMRYSHLANDTLLAAVEAGAKKMQGRAPTPRL